MKRFGIWGGIGLLGLIAVKLLPGALFATIAGLPGHPLVVHGAVVLLPLAGVALAIAVWFPKLPEWVAYVILGLAWVGSAAAIVAEATGKQLALITGLPNEHAEWGEKLGSFAMVFFAIAAAALFLRLFGDQQLLIKVFAVVAGGAAIFGIVLTVLAGHSGADAVWGDRVAGDSDASAVESAQPTATSNPAATESSAATPEAPSTPNTAGITLAEIATHNSASSCWTAVNSSVYDLTPFINQHPGGANRILRLCGINGTSQFMSEHAGQAEPEAELASLKIGAFAG